MNPCVMSSLRPTQDRVLVERVPEKRQGILVVPDSAKPKSKLGRIVSVGPGKWRDGEFHPTQVKAGMMVYFNSQWDDADDKLGDMQLIQEADILCVIEPEDA